MTPDFTLVTGAASGIGQKIAIQLSGERRLLLSDRNVDGLESTLSQCTNTLNHSCWHHDLGDISAIRGALEKHMAENRILVDSFVHCAGIMKVMRMKDVDYKNSCNLHLSCA